MKNPDGPPSKRLSIAPSCPGAYPAEGNHGDQDGKDGNDGKDLKEGKLDKREDRDNESPLPLPGKKPRGMAQNLKASLSRASLIRTFSGPTASVPSPSPAPTLPSLSSRPSSPHDIRHVHEPQPSAYRTGRFTALSDMHLHQMTTSLTFSPSPKNPGPSPAAPRPARLQKKPTTQNNAGKFNAALDQDERARRVFAELEGLCRTVEARRSLFEWREEWAKRGGRPGVLPRRGPAGAGEGVGVRPCGCAYSWGRCCWEGGIRQRGASRSRLFLRFCYNHRVV